MSTVRMFILAKMERARLKEIAARSKSGEEGTCAPSNSAQGSHDRRRAISAIASRSGHGREIGAFLQTHEVDEGERHATSFSGRATFSGHGLVAGQLSENQNIALSKVRVLMSPPRCNSSNLEPWLKTSVEIRARLSPVAAL